MVLLPCFRVLLRVPANPAPRQSIPSVLPFGGLLTNVVLVLHMGVAIAYSGISLSETALALVPIAPRQSNAASGAEETSTKQAELRKFSARQYELRFTIGRFLRCPTGRSGNGEK